MTKGFSKKNDKGGHDFIPTEKKKGVHSSSINKNNKVEVNNKIKNSKKLPVEEIELKDTIDGQKEKEILLGLDKNNQAVQLELSLERGYFSLSGQEFDLEDTFTEAEGKKRAEERVREDLENEPELFNQDWLDGFRKISETDARMFGNDMGDSMVDDRDLDELKEMAEQYDIEFDDPDDIEDDIRDNYSKHGLTQKDIDDETEKFTDLVDKTKEEAEEKLESKLIDEVSYARSDEVEKEILKDGLRSFIVDSEGLSSEEDFNEHYGNYLIVDIDEATEEAISADGWEHFMGDVEPIGNDKYALWSSGGQINMDNDFKMKKPLISKEEIATIKEGWTKLHLKNFAEMNNNEKILANKIIDIFAKTKKYNQEDIGELL